MDIDQIRREYLHGGLSSDNLQSNPIGQFQHWLQQAVDAKVQDPTAMSIATVSADGQPSQRIVLLKDCDDRGCQLVGRKILFGIHYVREGWR